jgi:hypothetical protein
MFLTGLSTAIQKSLGIPIHSSPSAGSQTSIPQTRRAHCNLSRLGREIVLAESKFPYPRGDICILTIPSMAYHEMRLILSKVLFHFDLKLLPESENWADQKTFSLWQKGELMCSLSAAR